MFGKGISKEGDILRPCCRLWHYREKSGAWYAYNGDKIGQGRENAKTYLRENPLVCEEVEAKVREQIPVRWYCRRDGCCRESQRVLEDEE